jgi:hypothetical protein
MSLFFLSIDNIDLVRFQTRTAAEKMRLSSNALGNFKPAFREIGKDIDALIRRNFDSGWPGAPLRPFTLRNRAGRRGYYRREPRVRGRVGRWTDRMYKGLLGQSPHGRILMGTFNYGRVYEDSSDRARRVTWFHEGIAGSADEPSQLPRPFWKELERTDLAIRGMSRYIDSRVTGRFRS